MKYFELLNKAKESTQESASHMNNQIILIVSRKLGFYVAPIFLLLNISANQISILGLFLGIFSSLYLYQGKIYIGVLLYIIILILDNADGTVARVNDEATFFGRFIDGYIGIVVDFIMRLGLSGLVATYQGTSYLFYLGILSTILCPLQYFIYDRYSTFVRWIKEEGVEINIMPYLIPETPRLINLIIDLRQISLLLLPLLSYLNYNIFILISTFFLLCVIEALHGITKHFQAANTHFRVNAKHHR
tara:strand:+ start:182 stop:919 length:738 start_codon:yes stop_codon:yes gene_type:complete